MTRREVWAVCVAIPHWLFRVLRLEVLLKWMPSFILLSFMHSFCRG